MRRPPCSGPPLALSKSLLHPLAYRVILVQLPGAIMARPQEDGARMSTATTQTASHHGHRQPRNTRLDVDRARRDRKGQLRPVPTYGKCSTTRSTSPILDQQRAGVDIITDGEMRRWYFVQGFYKRMAGLEDRAPVAQGRSVRVRHPAALPRGGEAHRARRGWASWRSSSISRSTPTGRSRSPAPARSPSPSTYGPGQPTSPAPTLRGPSRR